MEDECSPLSWGYCSQEEGMEELKHTLLFSTLELEKTLISAKEEITRREFELIHVSDVLSKVMKERDEAQGRCQKLMLEKLKLQQEIASFSVVSSSEDRCYSDSYVSVGHKYISDTSMFDFLKTFLGESLEDYIPIPIFEYSSDTDILRKIKSRNNINEDESKPGESNKQISSPDSNKTLVSSPGSEPPESPPPQLPKEALKLIANRQLPEKGKLLQAVKDAGPLLQNLLLAGPLPQWQHPPPQLTSIDIPPVAISSPKQQLVNQDSFNNLNGCLTKKRGPEIYEAGSDSSPNAKYQKVVSPLNNNNWNP